MSRFSSSPARLRKFGNATISTVVALLASLLVPQSAQSLPSTTIVDDALVEFSRFTGKYSVSTDGSSSSSTLTVEKATGANDLEAAYLVLVGQGINSRGASCPSPSTTQMTFDGSVTTFSHVAEGSGTFFCNYFVDVTQALSSSLNVLSAGQSTSFSVSYNTSAFTGASLTAIFDNPTVQDGTVSYLFGHAPVTPTQTTFSFPAIQNQPSSDSAILSVGIGWTIQASPFGTSNEGYNYLRIGTSSNPQPVTLSAFAGGRDDGDSSTGGFITVGGVGDSTDLPPESWSSTQSFRSDDELYDIASFLNVGDTSFTLESQNPRGDDTIFQLVLHLKDIVAQRSVAFDANGGTGSMTPQLALAPASLMANSFQRSGWDFAGWNTAPNGSGTTYSNQATYAFSADVTLYAQWTLAVTPPATSTPPAPASYDGPVPISLNPNPVYSSESNDVALTGKRLAGITRAVVDGKEITIHSAAAELLTMTFPALAVGTYTVDYYSDYGKLSHQNSLEVIPRPTQVAPESVADNSSRFFEKERFSNFFGDSPRLSDVGQSSLGDFLDSLEGKKVQKVTCLGSTSGVPAEITDALLARTRAEVACDQARELFPEAEMRIEISIGQGVGQFFRAVTVFAAGSAS